MKTRWTIPVAGAMATVAFVGTATTSTAQSQSVLDGVYSETQAARGKTVYLIDCAQCHGRNLMGGEGATELVGSPFIERWSGRTLGDLYATIQQTMPLGSPSALSGREYADVVAYILSENAFPGGEQELPEGLEALNTIRITVRR